MSSGGLALCALRSFAANGGRAWHRSRGPGEVVADWSDAPRADRYRVWKQVVGVDAEFVAFGTPTDSDFTLTGLPSGATVKVRVTAVNDAGESEASETKQIVVP